MNKPRIAVIGIGNPDRGDDAAGIEVARRLADISLDNVEIHQNTGDLTSIIDIFNGRTDVFLIDTMVSASGPGQVLRIDALRDKLDPDHFPATSHTLNIPDIIRLAETLNRLPLKLIIYAIEGVEYSVGAGLSKCVDDAVSEVVERLLAEIKEIIEA